MSEKLLHKILEEIHALREDQTELKHTIKKLEKIMATAIDTLSASINALTAADVDLSVNISAAIAELGTPSATDAQILTLSSTVDAQTARIVALSAALKAALTPTGTTTGVAPTITVQPGSVVAAIGTPANLTVAATGDQPMTFQWLFNGAPIAGATSATLTIPSVTAADMGAYSVIVTNGAGSVTSAVTNLTNA